VRPARVEESGRCQMKAPGWRVGQMQSLRTGLSGTGRARGRLKGLGGLQCWWCRLKGQGVGLVHEE
jgi:hypothetical protein